MAMSSAPRKKSPFELRNVAINLAAGGSAGQVLILPLYTLQYNLLIYLKIEFMKI